MQAGNSDQMTQSCYAQGKRIIIRNPVFIPDQQAGQQTGLTGGQSICHRLLAKPCNAVRQPAKRRIVGLCYSEGNRYVIVGFGIRRCNIAPVCCLIGCTIKAFGVAR